MAAIKKYKASHVAQTLNHDNRTPNDNINRGNEKIDPERTNQNYWFKKGGYDEWKMRKDEVHCMKRDDIVVLDELIVTLPKDVKSNDERAFFEACFDYACNRFGSENVINAVVHKDETTPHIHIGFIPIVKDKLRNGEECYKVNHSKACPRKYYQSYHQELSDFVKQAIGYEVAILNGATDNGNKTISKLKAEKLQAQVEELSKKFTELQTARDDAIFEKVGAIKAIGEKLSGGAKKLTAAEVETVKNVVAVIAQIQAEYQRQTEEAEQAKKVAESHKKALQEREQQFNEEVQVEALRLFENEIAEVRKQASAKIDKAQQGEKTAKIQTAHIKDVCEFITGEPFELSEQKFNAWVKEQKQTAKKSFEISR